MHRDTHMGATKPQLRLNHPLVVPRTSHHRMQHIAQRRLVRGGNAHLHAEFVRCSDFPNRNAFECRGVQRVELVLGHLREEFPVCVRTGLRPWPDRAFAQLGGSPLIEFFHAGSLCSLRVPRAMELPGMPMTPGLRGQPACGISMKCCVEATD